jgi:glycine cleavage system H protein
MVAIFVALMFVGLVLTDLTVQKWQAWRVAHSAPAMSPQGDFATYALDALSQVPEGVHLGNQHTWVRPDPQGGLEIGADALIARAMGAVRRVILPEIGGQVTAGQPLFRLEHNGRTITIPASITGRVLAVNSRLAAQPALLSSDPYGSGWVCHLTPTRLEGAAPAVRFGEQATMWLKDEFVRFQEFVFGQVSPDFALGVTSQDGGIPAMGCLIELDATAWRAFEADFLQRV